ncbi:MAG TPA: FliH/SctL family protein [Polyangiaceae bacterium]|jgi:flagellar biosynthesis/type III secretory pathway protein FliH
MTSPRPRIIRAAEASTAAPLPWPPAPPSPARRRIAREEIEARAEAERIVGEAQARAEEIERSAREAATAAAGEARRSALEDAEAKVAARWIALREAESKRLERDADRLLDVAVALAERLLGASLRLDAARIADIATAAIAEARGARRIVIEAHPADADALRTHLEAVVSKAQAVDIRADEGLARGDLRLQTDIGTIDAKLAPRLERLAAALRDAVS